VDLGDLADMEARNDADKQKAIDNFNSTKSNYETKLTEAFNALKTSGSNQSANITPTVELYQDLKKQQLELEYSHLSRGERKAMKSLYEDKSREIIAILNGRHRNADGYNNYALSRENLIALSKDLDSKEGSLSGEVYEKFDGILKGRIANGGKKSKLGRVKELAIKYLGLKTPDSERGAVATGLKALAGCILTPIVPPLGVIILGSTAAPFAAKGANRVYQKFTGKNLPGYRVGDTVGSPVKSSRGSY